MPEEIVVPDYYPSDTEFQRGYVSAMKSELCEEYCSDQYFTGYREGKLRLFLKIRNGRLNERKQDQ